MSASSISRVRKVAVNGSHSVGYFIHRARVQKLYRSFLRVCQTDEERQQVRAEFKTNQMRDPATIKEAEIILKQLQLARGTPSTHTAFTKTAEKLQIKSVGGLSGGPKVSVTRPLTMDETVKADDADEGELAKVEWPWQRTGEKQ